MKTGNIVSTLYAFWPESEPPSEVQLARKIGPPATPTDPLAAPQALWARGWRWGFERYLSAWAGYVDDLPGGIGLAMHTHSASLKRRLQRTQYYLGLATLLDPRDAPRSYQAFLRTCLDFCPDTPAVFDGCSIRVRENDELRALVEARGRLDVQELYRLEGVHPKQNGEGIWMHTHGLQRADFPDVEILDVPPDTMAGGVHLINGFVDRYFDRELPSQGEPIDLVPGAPVVWITLETVLRDRPEHAIGGSSDRRRGSHDGFRALLAQHDGDRPDQWMQPLDAIAALHEPCPTCRPSTQEDACRAKASWTRFARLFVDHGRSSAWQFITRLLEKGEGRGTGTWHEVVAVGKSRVRARPMDPPPGSRRRYRWYGLDRLLDWQIITPWGLIDPRSAEDGNP